MNPFLICLACIALALFGTVFRTERLKFLLVGSVPLPTVRTPAEFATQAGAPRYDLESYLPPIQGGRTVTVSGKDLATKIQQAQDSDAATVIISGGGVIDKQVTLKKRTIFRDGEYRPDLPGLLDSGVFMLRSGVRVEFENATLYEPDWIVNNTPAVTLFEAYDLSAKVADPINNAHFGKVENIAILNPKIRGRQTVFNNAGVRQTIALNNCQNCAVINADIDGFASIGIQVGGSAEHGNFARRVLIKNAKLSRGAAAHIAVVNGDDVIVDSPQISKLGRAGAPGGVSGVDIETNTQNDHCSNLTIMNGTFDFRGGEAWGSAILAQNATHQDHCRGLRILNNRAFGDIHSMFTSGLFFTGTFRDAVVSDFEIVRAKQSGVQLYGTQQALFRNITLISVGGGGLPAIYMLNSSKNRFVGLSIRVDERIGGSVSEEIREVESTGNTFDRKKT